MPKAIRRMVEEGLPTGVKGGVIPFSHEVEPPQKNFDHRVRTILEFIDGSLEQPILDIGEPNRLVRRLQKEFGPIESTFETDFNISVEAPRTAYRTIFCFEVIEHVMNPLNFMIRLRDLTTDDGVIYLSTPRLGVTGIYHTTHHFTEYKEPKLDALFAYAGLEIEKKKSVTFFPWWFMFFGIRPVFRTIFHRNILYKLRKKLT